MNRIESEYSNGNLTVKYVRGENGCVGLLVLPSEMDGGELTDAGISDREPEPLVELHVRGDMLPSRYANGATTCGSASAGAMRFAGQTESGGRIVTELSDGAGRIARHTLIFRGRTAEVYTEFFNGTTAPLTLEMLASGTFGMLSPYTPGEQSRALEIITARSFWSAEGRLSTETAESLDLETSWLRNGVRVYKIMQTGSMPVRGHFPFMAVRDTEHNVTWASSVSAASSWQMEARRRDTGLSVSGGIADFDHGHWAKTLMPQESFVTPPMYITAVAGGIDEASDALLDAERIKKPHNLKELPVMFNEYCTTWGAPTHDNLQSIAKTLCGRGFEYLVIDAGWFRTNGHGWWETVGDSAADRSFFPEGMKAAADMIRSYGMTPGIWFEPETCGSESEIHDREDMLLKRNGTVIDTGSRRFLDMRSRTVREHLRERVIGFLRGCGFGYVKIDYNDCIGIGCDGAESLGEGLRQNMEASLDFYRELRRECPDIIMENCASGGHRLSPAFMEIFDMASFSDAHECISIPLIAADLHRLILPEQSQIWAVLHGTDSLRRVNYSMINTFLGVMCLSGDIYALSEDAWRVVTDDIAFYKRVRHIIRDGSSRIYRSGGEDLSYNDPPGWQAVVRRAGRETLVVLHTFRGRHEGPIKVNVGDGVIKDVCALDGASSFSVSDGVLTAHMTDDFDAAAVLIEERG